MHAVALIAAALAVVTPQPKLDHGAAQFRIKLDSGFERVRETPLAKPRGTAIGAYLTCRSGGVGVLYGTAGRRVRAVSAVLADGRRVHLERSVAPSRWRYSGSVFTHVMEANVSILEVRGYDAHGHRIVTVRYTPADPCPMTRPPDPKPNDKRQVDPDIVTGEVAHRLGIAERRWRRARIEDYDFEVIVSCFCAPPANQWIASHVRDGHRTGGSEWSVPKLFSLIRRDIERRPASLDVDYGPHGVPTNIAYDGGLNIADDEVSTASRHFTRR
jgi:uncharacterized protein DUF6174